MANSPMCSMVGAKAALTALCAELNAISGHDGVLKVFSGALPATCETADPSGALSVGCTFASTAFTITDGGANGLATGTAGSIAADTNIPVFPGPMHILGAYFCAWQMLMALDQNKAEIYHQLYLKERLRMCGEGRKETEEANFILFK